MRRLQITDFFGLEVICSKREDIDLFLRDCLENNRKIKITTMNAQIAYYYLNDESAAKAIIDSVVIPDGTGLSWALNRLNKISIERYPGVEIMYRLCQIGASISKKAFILGGVEGVAEKAADTLQEKTGIETAGYRNGYFDFEKDSPNICNQIKESEADVLFVGLGAPKQEKWIERFFKHTGCTIAIGVGGSLDIYAQTAKRAPKWVQRANLEWIYRILQHPVRKFKVIFQIMAFIRYVLKGKKRQAG
ncbi:MAG TPA: WecB/TagA/CpsF family glycosyltransferase [Thermotogota bacterium]|nr:WecB/TagA/CpsF family glycosyltransferase [Thermotogota bacterium]HRW33816.1 WecB/TagA/CpsF family glycosyltransferase [Thermotogota bacterium]